jgi:hypothetical protein
MAAKGKPNILIIWGDDIGWFNVSAYNLGIMGYRTPNIDRIAREGALFTDWYGQQSCTAGRAAFITGQSPIRTGLTKVGLPGADLGLRAEDPRREGHELRRRLARAVRDPLAGRHQARHGLQRDLLAHRHAADAGGRRRRAGHRR